MKKHLNVRSAPLHLALLLAALVALAIPTMALATGSPPANQQGQSKDDNGKKEDGGKKGDGNDGASDTPPATADTPANLPTPSGHALRKRDAANPANHNPPAKDGSRARQNGGNGHAANGCTGSVKTTVADGSVVNANKYATGDAVYLSGSKFPASTIFNFEVIHVQTKTLVASGSFTDGADGSFLRQVVQDPALTGHEYKVIAYYNTASGHRCHKSDNFFFVGGRDVKGAGKTVICVVTAKSKKYRFKELKLPAAALQHRHKKVGDIVPAPAGGCPTLGEVKAVEEATMPTQVTAGEQCTIEVTTVPNMVILVTGPGGLERLKTASDTGLAKVTVRPKRAGVVTVRGASSTPLGRIGVLGARRASGLSLTG